MPDGAGLAPRDACTMSEGRFRITLTYTTCPYLTRMAKTLFTALFTVLSVCGLAAAQVDVKVDARVPQSDPNTGIKGDSKADLKGDHKGEPPGAFIPPASANIIPGERLSDWLLRNPRSSEESDQIHWRVPSEQGAQLRLRQAILERLSATHVPQALVDFVAALEPTGRLVVASSDARWLQFAPDQDPVLEVIHTVLRPARSSLVTLLKTDGSLCAMPHVPGALVRDYLRVCLPEQAADDVSWGWIVQPDGRSRRFGIALWNEEPQDEPASGAWIWAPAAQAGVSEATSDNLTRFLATQLPAQSLAAIQGSAVSLSLQRKGAKDLAATQPDSLPFNFFERNLLPGYSGAVSGESARLLPQSLPRSSSGWRGCPT